MHKQLLDADAFVRGLHQRDSVEMRFVVPALAALLVHAGVQVQEPGARQFAGVWALLTAAATYWIHKTWGVGMSSAALTTLQMNGVFVLTIFYSMALYRIVFHRLRSFPGPRWMALSKWLMVYPDLQGQRPYMFQKLHRQYGDVVRVGPRELSVIDPAALSTIYGGSGVGMRCTRGPWYDFTVESTKMRARNLQSTPTMADHAARRKVWDAAFSIKAIKGYEENIINNTNLVMEQISRREKEGPIDICQWCSWFGFDVMGELGFGRGFDMIRTAKTAHEIHVGGLGSAERAGRLMKPPVRCSSRAWC